MLALCVWTLLLLGVAAFMHVDPSTQSILEHSDTAICVLFFTDCLLMIVSCSIAILQLEVPAGGNIATAEDALWWAVSTVTTVGYGDRYPVSSEGRVVAVFLVASGVGAFGMLSGLVASWFLSPAVKETDSDVAELKAMIVELKEQLRSQQGRTAGISEIV